MEHEREFGAEKDEAKTQAAKKRMADAERTAAAYARLFSTDDGKHILSDLRRKFGHDRQRFDIRDRNHSTVTAAIIDGQCSVLREIENAARAGGLNC